MNFKKVKEKYSFVVEGKDIAGFFIGAAVVIALSFGLGILIGKEIYTSPGGKKVKTEESKKERSKVTQKEESYFPVPSTVFTLSKKEEKSLLSTQKEKTSSQEKVREREKTIPGKTEKSQAAKEVRLKSEEQKKEQKKEQKRERVHSANKTEVKRIAPPEFTKRKEVKKTKKKSKKTLHSKKEKNYTVQVASYRNRKDAIKIVRSLRKKGFESYLTTISFAEKGVWHRVRVGYFESIEEAKNLAKKLENLGFKPYVTRVDK